MTIRLLSTYDSFPPQSILTLAPTVEAALIADGNASATLTGGTVAYRERAPVMIQPAVQKHGSVALIANRKATVPLSEGAALTITPTAGTTGTYQRYDATGAAVGALTTIGATALTVGAYEGDFTVEIKCTTGTMVVKASNAVLNATMRNAVASTLTGGGFNGWTYSQYQGIGQNRAFTNVVCAWGPFSGVKLIFANSQTLAATIDKVSVGTGPTIYPAGVANLRAATNVYGAVVGPYTVPARGANAKQPGLFITPWLPAVSQPRAAGELDGGTRELLFVNVYSATGNLTVPVTDLASGQALPWSTIYDPTNEGFTFQSAGLSAADAVTTPSLWTAATPMTLPAQAVFGVIFNYDEAMPMIAVFGDSYRLGMDGASGIQSYCFKAAARLRKVKKLSFVNFAKSGSTMADINQNALALIDAVGPTAIVITCATSNSPIATQADFDAQWALFKEVVAYALSKGILVIGETGLPNTGYNATRNGYRLKQTKRLYALAAASGGRIVVADYDSFADANGQWADPSMIVSSGPDVGHPNPAGHEKLTPPLYAALDSVIPASAP